MTTVWMFLWLKILRKTISSLTYKWFCLCILKSPETEGNGYQSFIFPSKHLLLIKQSLLAVFLSLISVTHGQPASWSRWPSFWHIARRSTVMLYHAPHFISFTFSLYMYLSWKVYMGNNFWISNLVSISIGFEASRPWCSQEIQDKVRKIGKRMVVGVEEEAKRSVDFGSWKGGGGAA